MSASTDWTAAWTEARALLLVSRTRDPSFLAEPASRRLLELALAVATCRAGLHVHAHVILPGSLHVIGALPSRASWPRIMGKVKAAHARWDASRRGPAAPKGPRWFPSVSVRPLAECEIPRAVRELHLLPVRQHLVTTAAEWDASSWHAAHGR